MASSSASSSRRGTGHGGEPGETEAVEIAEVTGQEDQTLGHHLVHLGGDAGKSVDLSELSTSSRPRGHEGHGPERAGQRPMSEVWRMPWRVEVLAKIWMLEGCRLPSLGLLEAMGPCAVPQLASRLIRFQGKVPSPGALLKLIPREEGKTSIRQGSTTGVFESPA